MVFFPISPVFLEKVTRVTSDMPVLSVSVPEMKSFHCGEMMAIMPPILTPFFSSCPGGGVVGKAHTP